jgi:hypothetical protein
MLDNLTRRDAYFVGYADAYAKRVEQINRENRTYEESLNRWPDSKYAPGLRTRIANNNREKRILGFRIQLIMANVRR